MLSSIAIFGGSKGMVAMPDISGMSRDTAILVIESAGLVFASSSNVSSTSTNNGKVVSQSVASGTLIDYGSSITFEVGLYTAPVGPVVTFVEDPTEYEVNDGPYECSPIYLYTKIQDRKNVVYTYKYVDGIKDTSYTPTMRTISQADTIYTANSEDCGYVAPPAVTCTMTSEAWGQWSSCSSTSYTRTRTERLRETCSDGTARWVGDYYSVSEACCISSTAYTSCSSCNCNTKICSITETTRCSTGTTTTVIATGQSVGCVGGGCSGAQ